MATNNFKPFATGAGANVTAQADYEALAALLTGFQSGKANSAQINKALRQGTVMAAVLASFIVSNANVDVLDNGDTATLLTNLVAALKVANTSAGFLNKSNNLSDVLSTATALANLGGLAKSNNLSDIASAVTALTNLGGLAIANNFSEIAAKGAATVATALANLNGLNKNNNLSDLGSVSQALTNLGLGTAAVRAVGTGANQIPDMNSFGSSLITNGYYKLPGGLIIQWVTVTGSTTATVPITFPIPFPNQLFGTAMAMDWTSPGYPTLQSQTLVGVSVNTWNSSGTRSALAVTIIAVGK